MTKTTQHTLVLETLEKLTLEKNYSKIRNVLETIPNAKAKGDVFELYLAYLFRGQGFMARVSGGKNDGGADILLSNAEAPNDVFRIIQAKNHKSKIDIDSITTELRKFDEISSKKYNCKQFEIISINGYVSGFKKYERFMKFQDFSFIKDLIDTYDAAKYPRPKIDLFNHNHSSYNKLKALLKKTDRACIIQATGTGKSFLIGKYLNDHLAEKSILVTPSHIIPAQMMEKFDWALCSTTCLTYSKLQKMSESQLKALGADNIILDEFHRAGAKEWGEGVNRLLKTNSNAIVIGTSATPIRHLDNCRDMASEVFYSRVANQIDLPEAIARDILSAPKYVASLYKLDEEVDSLQTRVADSALRSKGKSNHKKKLNKIKLDWEEASGVPKILKKHLKGERNKFIVFCNDIDHLEDMKLEVHKWFRKAFKDELKANKGQILTFDVHSQKSSNQKTLEEFKNAKDLKNIHILFSIDMLNEGLHISDVHGVILLRKTSSPRIFFQQIGRCIQAGTNHTPIIFDLVNNFSNVKANDLKVEMDEAYEKENKIRSGLGLGGVTERMEIVDETMDISEVLEKVRFSTASWNVQYEFLKEFLEVNGGRFPERRDEFPEGNALGNWCGRQRKNYEDGVILIERKKKLNSIGFVWKVASEAWNTQLNFLKEYIEIHSEQPNANEYYPEGNRLGGWCSDQRRRYINEELEKDKIKKMDDVGFVWKVLDSEWEKQFSYLIEFHQKNSEFPSRDVEYPLGNKLGQWSVYQRGRYRQNKLELDRVDRLEGIGFYWEHQEYEWQKQFSFLVSYLEEHDENFPGCEEEYPKDNCLGTWCGKQRGLYLKGNLPDEKIEKLKSVCFIFDTLEYNWMTQFEHLKKYIKIYNGEFPPHAEEFPEGNRLGAWCSSQRVTYSEKELSENRIEQLKELSFIFDQKKYKWIEQLNYLKDFIEINKKTPSDNDEHPEGNRLGSWCSTQRQRYSNEKLPVEYIRYLDDVGFVWDIAKQRWEQQFLYLEEYMKKFNEIPYKLKEYPEGNNLGAWCHNQRNLYKKNKLSSEYVGRLETIGFKWYPGKKRILLKCKKKSKE